MGEDDLVFVEIWATCLTTGCGNFGIQIHTIAPVGGDILCGPCGVPVTNITDIQPEAGKELPAWILEALAAQNSTN